MNYPSRWPILTRMFQWTTKKIRKLTMSHLGATTWKDTQRNTRKGILSWHTSLQHNFTTWLHPVETISNAQNMTSTQSENSGMYVRNLHSSAYLMPSSDDPIFCGQATSWPEVSTWNRACDKILTKLSSYMDCILKHRYYCHVGNKAIECKWGLLQDADFAGDLSDSKINIRWIAVNIWWSNICADFVAMPKANCCVTKRYWSWNHFLRRML